MPESRDADQTTSRPVEGPPWGSARPGSLRRRSIRDRCTFQSASSSAVTGPASAWPSSCGFRSGCCHARSGIRSVAHAGVRGASLCHASSPLLHQRHPRRLLRPPRGIIPDEELHRHAAENLDRADALLFGRVTYEMMEAAWRLADGIAGRCPTGCSRSPARSTRPRSTSCRAPWTSVDWNAELLRGRSGEGRSSSSSGSRARDCSSGGVTAPAGAGGAGPDRRVRVRGASQARGPRADVVRGAVEAPRPEAREPAGVRLGRGGDAVRAEKVAVRAAQSWRPGLRDQRQHVVRRDGVALAVGDDARPTGPRRSRRSCAG